MTLVTGLALAGGAFAQDAAPPAEPIPSRPVQTVTVSGSCSDRACLARAYMEDAQEACAPLIERLAEHDAEWIYRPSAGIFDRFDWPDGAGTTIRYRGDRIRFQTPSGSWARMSYECGYDVAHGQALFARAERGRGRPGPAHVSAAQEPRTDAEETEISEPRQAVPTPRPAVRTKRAKSAKAARAAVKRTVKKARAAPTRSKKKPVARRSNGKAHAAKRTAAKKTRKRR